MPSVCKSHVCSHHLCFYSLWPIMALPPFLKLMVGNNLYRWSKNIHNFEHMTFKKQNSDFQLLWAFLWFTFLDLGKFGILKPECQKMGTTHSGSSLWAFDSFQEDLHTSLLYGWVSHGKMRPSMSFPNRNCIVSHHSMTAALWKHSQNSLELSCIDPNLFPPYVIVPAFHGESAPSA